MRSWKSRIAGFVASLGGAEIAHALVGRGGRAFILFYHRVIDEPNLLQLAVEPGRFEGQMRVLRRRARVVPLADLARRLEDPEPLEENLAAITFDDGYRDNAEIAAPILERLGLPATFFVATDFIDGNAVPFWDRLEHALRGAWEAGVGAEDFPGTGRAELDTLARRCLGGEAASFEELVVAVRENGVREALLRAFEEIGPSLEPEGGLMMDWDDLRSLAARGFAIESHTASHPWLPGLGDEDLVYELAHSKARIERELGTEVKGFAYPWGGVLPEQRPAVEAAGYRWAVSVVDGAERLVGDRLFLKRIAAGLGPPGVLDLKLALAR